jgi:hypothetical protein
MRIDPDCCLSCGSHAHPQYLDVPDNCPELNSKGRLGDLWYWFCSVECYQKEVRKYLDEVFDFDAEYDSELGDYSEWLEYQPRAISLAVSELIRRVKAEDKHLLEEDMRKEEEMEERERERQQAADDRKAMQEQEKAERKARQDRLDEQRAQDRADRLAEKQQREQEKRDAEERERLEAEQKELDWQETLKPKPIPQDKYYAGTWIVSPAGRGKTTLLQVEVVEAIEKGACTILMDGKGDLINSFRHFQMAKDNYIIIEPDNPIAINPLDVPKANVTKAVDFLEYLFASLLEAKMTPLQQTLFRSVFRAMITTFPNPNLGTFRDFLSKGLDKYRPHIDALEDERLKEFFYIDFDQRYAERRREVIQRLDLLLENDFIKPMLLAPKTKMNFAKLLDEPRLIIIDNNQDKLGKWGAEFFGRFWVSQLWVAATARKSSKSNRPVFCFIDEAQLVIKRDERIADILDECRSKNIAMVLAHQRIEQIQSENVLSALKNCAIRITNSDDDAKALAENFRTTPEFLRSLEVGQFAVFVRDVTRQHPFIRKVVPFDSSHLHRMTQAEEQQLKANMKAWYGVEPPQMQRPPVQAASAKQTPAQFPEPSSRPATEATGVAQASIPPKHDPSAPTKWTPPQ